MVFLVFHKHLFLGIFYGLKLVGENGFRTIIITKRSILLGGKIVCGPALGVVRQVQLTLLVRAYFRCASCIVHRLGNCRATISREYHRGM